MKYSNSFELLSCSLQRCFNMLSPGRSVAAERAASDSCIKRLPVVILELDLQPLAKVKYGHTYETNSEVLVYIIQAIWLPVKKVVCCCDSSFPFGNLPLEVTGDIVSGSTCNLGIQEFEVRLNFPSLEADVMRSARHVPSSTSPVHSTAARGRPGAVGGETGLFKLVLYIF